MEAEVFSYSKLIELGPAYAVIAVLIYVITVLLKQVESLREVLAKLVTAVEKLDVRSEHSGKTLQDVLENILKGKD